MWTAVAATLPLVLSTPPAAPEADAADHTRAAWVFEREELEAVPSVLGGPLGVVPLLPGAAPLLSPLAVSTLRGAQPSTTGILFDDVRLPSAFHLLVGPSMLQEAMVSSVTVHRGAAPIANRGIMGGALTLEPTTPPEIGVHGESTLDLLRLGSVAHFRTADGATLVTAGASVAWTPWLFTRVAGPSSPSWDPDRPGLRADLYDYFARGEQSVGTGTLRALAIGSVDSGSSASDTDLLGARVDFHRVDVRLKHPYAKGEADVGVTLGQDRVVAELGGAVSQTRAEVVERSVKGRVAWAAPLSAKARVRIGLDVDRAWATLTQRWTSRAPVIVDGPTDDPPLETAAQSLVADARLTGAWAEADLSDDPAWRWTLGFRADNYALMRGDSFVAWEPRAAVWHQVSSRLSVDGALALLHQPPSFLVPLPGAELAALRFGLQQSLRAQAGAAFSPASNLVLRVDGYFDRLFRTIELAPLDRDFLQTVKGSPEDVLPRKQSQGAAFGVELSVRRTFVDGWFGWVSYSWQRSLRQARFTVRNTFGEPVDQRAALLPSPLERVHLAQLVGGKRFGAWMISSAAHFHSGATESGGLSSFTQIEGRDRLRPGPKWIEADLDRVERLPPFFRLDVRVARTWQAGPVALVGSLDVQNVTFSREVTRYAYVEVSPSLIERDAGDLTLTRTAGGSGVPAFPLPMLGLAARY